MSKTLLDDNFDDDQQGMTGNVAIDRSLASSLLDCLDCKYAPAFEQLGENERQKAALYFLPHTSKKETLSVTRPRVIKWYCPFADQTAFPSGVRYSINVYSGCEHGCRYCYVQGYSAAKVTDAHAKCKDHFRPQLWAVAFGLAQPPCDAGLPYPASGIYNRREGIGFSCPTARR